jgi:hypothetical protein
MVSGPHDIVTCIHEVLRRVGVAWKLIGSPSFAKLVENGPRMG